MGFDHIIMVRGDELNKFCQVLYQLLHLKVMDAPAVCPVLTICRE